MEIIPDDPMGFLGSVGDPTRNLFHMEHSRFLMIEGMKIVSCLGDRIRNVGKERYRCVTILAFAPREIDRLGQKAAGGSSLEPPHFKTEFLEIVAQRGKGVSHPPPRLGL